MVIILLWYYSTLLPTDAQRKDENFGVPCIHCTVPSLPPCSRNFYVQLIIYEKDHECMLMWCNSSASAITAEKPWQPWPVQRLPALLATASLLLTAALKTFGFYQHTRILAWASVIPSKKGQSEEQELVSCWGTTLLAESPSVHDLSVSALRERMRFSLWLAYLIFTVSMKVRCLKSCYCQWRIGESSQWSLEGDSVVQRQYPGPFYIPYHKPSVFQTALQKGHGSPVRPVSYLQWLMVLPCPLKWH